MAKMFLVLDFPSDVVPFQRKEVGRSLKRETHDAKISALPLRLVSSSVARRLYFPCCLCLFFFSSGVRDHSYPTESLDHVLSTKKCH